MASPAPDSHPATRKHMPRAARRTTERKKQATKPASKRAAQPSLPAVPPGCSLWVLDGTWDDRGDLKSLGATWQPGYGWTYVGASLPAALRPYLPAPYSWAAFNERRLLRPNVTVGNATPDTSTGTITLRPDQVEDVNTIVNAHRAGCPEFALASLVGTGKTITAIAAAKRLSGVRRILVVMPLGVMPAWRRSLRDMGDGGKEWVFLNYQSTKKLLDAPASAAAAKRQATKNRQIASKGTPHTQWDLVITDESHWLGNPESQQSRVVDRAIAGPKGQPAFVIRMSATLGNNPAQLSYLHRGFAWRTGNPIKASITSEDYVAWCKTYGIGVEQSFGNKLTWASRSTPKAEARDIRKVRHLLFGGDPAWALRRVPDWPEPPRFLAPVELTPNERDAYDTEWALFKAAMGRVTSAERSHARIAATGDTSAARAAAHELSELKRAGRAAGIRYQQKAGLLRASGTADLIENFVTKGVQVGAYCQHIDVVEALRHNLEGKGLTVGTYTGRNTGTREDERVAFQRGATNVLLYTTAEGLNMHAGEKAVQGNNVPRVSVIAQPNWSPRLAAQAEGRAHRDGQIAPCYYAYALNTIEERIMQTLIPAMRTMLAMMGDDTTSLEALSADLGIPLIGV